MAAVKRADLWINVEFAVLLSVKVVVVGVMVWRWVT